MLTMGAALRVVTDWVGDPATVTSYFVRFTRPVVVPDDDDGAEVTFTATVVGDRRDRRSAVGHRGLLRRSRRCSGAAPGRGRSWIWRDGCTREPSAAAAVSLAAHTTLRVGGPASRMVTSTPSPSWSSTFAELMRAGEPVLILGGGSNVLIGDEGFAGTVVRVATRGIRPRTCRLLRGGDHGRGRASTGTTLVAHAVERRNGAGSRPCPASPAWSERHRSRTSARTAPRSAS